MLIFTFYKSFYRCTYFYFSFRGQDEGDRKEAFRKWFSNVGELRSLFSDATVLALSATCTVSFRKKVMKILQLAEDTTEINLSPNKSNIKLVSSKIKN